MVSVPCLRPLFVCLALSHFVCLCRQHMRNCTLTGNQLFQDILSYNLSLIGCSDASSDEDVCAATGTSQGDTSLKLM